MNDKMIKFVSTNICIMILLLVVLISHYTLIGFIAFFVGSLLLFLGTLLDNKKANNGVTSKMAFIIFMIVLTLFGMWLPFIMKNKFHFEQQGQANIWGIIISLALGFMFFIMAGVDKFKHYVVRRCLKYSGQILFLLAGYYFWDLPISTFYLTVITVGLFLLTDLFSTKYRKYNDNDFKDLDDDKAFWMTLFINLCIIALNLFYRSYLLKFLTKEALANIIENVTSGFNVPLFIILMIVLTFIFAYIGDKESTYRALSDGYFTLSLAGFVLLFRIYESNKSIESFVVLCCAVLMLFIIGFSLPSAGVGSRSNPIYYLIRLRNNSIESYVMSISITVLSIIGIIFAKKGYIIPIAFFVCAALIISISFLIFKESWVKVNIRWQITLLSIYSFLISISVVNQTLNSSLFYLGSLLVISSIAIWTLGVRQDVIKYRYEHVAQCITCIASCGIGLIAVA